MNTAIQQIKLQQALQKIEIFGLYGEEEYLAKLIILKSYELPNKQLSKN